MIDVMLPRGEGLAAMLHAYFDESGTHKGAPVLCIAGYVAEPEQWKEMCESWKKMLQEEGNGLDVFHMVDLKHWSKKVKEHLRREECQILIAKGIGLIKKHVRFGLSVTVSAEEYDRVVSQPFRSRHGVPSTFCAQVAITYVAKYAIHNACEPVSYFFESGDKGEGHLEKIFHMIKNDYHWTRDFALDRYAFLPKRDAAGLQAADALAYFTSTSWQQPDPPELEALRQLPHWVRHVTQSEAQEIETKVACDVAMDKERRRKRRSPHSS